MFRIAALALFFFTAFWPLTHIQNKLKDRNLNLHQLSLEAQFELQKKLLSAKDRAYELTADNTLVTKIKQNQTHSLNSMLNGVVRFPEMEFLAITNVSSCQFTAKTKSRLPIHDACSFPDNPYYYVKDLAVEDNYWAIQVFPFSQEKSGTRYQLIFGSKISLSWLAPNNQQAVKKYDISLGPPASHAITQFEKVDPALAGFALNSGDWVAKVNNYFEVFTIDVFDVILAFLFGITLVTLAILTFQFRKHEISRRSKETQFSDFLRKDLGINFKVNEQESAIDSWLKALKEIDLKAQTTLRTQKKEIAKLRSNLNDVNLKLKRSEAENAPLRRFKNIQLQFMKFGQDMTSFFVQYFANDKELFTKEQQHLSNELTTIESVLGEWAQGFALEGERRYLRRLCELNATSSEHQHKFQEQFQTLCSRIESLHQHLDDIRSSLNALSSSFLKIERSGKILFEASSASDNRNTVLTHERLDRVIHDITMNNFQNTSDIHLAESTPLSIQVHENFIYPFALALSQIANTIALNCSNDVSIQLKHKINNQTNYVVALFKIKNSQQTNSGLIENRDLDKSLNELEALLGPIGVRCQLIDLNRRQLVISLNWPELQPKAAITSNLTAMKNASGEILI